MKTQTIAALAVLLSACASAPLPQSQREFSFIEQTTLKQRDAYNVILAHLAKNLGDSNLAIKVRDPESGTIITQIAFDCPELKQFLDPNRHTPVFNLEVSTKDNRVRFVYEGIEDRIYNGMSGAPLGPAAIARADQASGLKTCTERHKAELIKALGAKRDANW